MKAAILGTTGYTGQILLRQLSGHRDIDTIIPVSSSKAGEPVISEDAGLHPSIEEKISHSQGKLVDVDTAAAMNPDVVFAALPHLASAEFCSPFYGKSVVIDLSADFRISDPALFLKAYGENPPRADLLDKAVYGLAEWYRKEIQKADIIANPGCYPQPHCFLYCLWRPETFLRQTL